MALKRRKSVVADVFYFWFTFFAGTSVCGGDSGGSMTFKEDDVYYIRGIVSQSPSKINHITQQLECDTREYAIYTDVAVYLQWIEENMEMKVDCPTVVRCANDSYWLVFMIVCQRTDNRK